MQNGSLLSMLINISNNPFLNMKVDENHCHIFTIHDCFMFPSPLYLSILEGYKSIKIDLK